MPLFLIERAIPGASDLTAAELTGIARTSNAAAASLGEPYAWLTSYVAGDKIYDLHEAQDTEAVIEHARRSGFPADVVAQVTTEFGPRTATAR